VSLLSGPSGSREATDPDADGAAQASLLAALAESCVLAMPAMLLMAGGRASPAGASAAFMAGTMVLFPAGVAALRRARHVPWAAPLGAAIAGVTAVSVGSPSLGGVVLRLGASALVTVRGASLAFRDRRDPVGPEIAWGAAALGAEAVFAAGTSLAAWRLPLIVAAPVFVSASLASRAATVWSDPQVEPPERARWRARIRLGALGYAAVVLGTAAAAIRGGVWERLGAIVAPVATAAIGLLLLVLLVILRPVFWLVQRVHLDPRAARDLLRRLRQSASRPTHLLTPGHGGAGPLIGRVLGFAAVAAIAWLAYRALRRFRPPSEGPDVADVTGLAPIARAPIPEGEREVRGRRRDELPADAVRRWYAEVLLALRRRDLPKEPSTTPAEFLREVRRTYPTLGEHLELLTRAYEDVRYGSLRLDPRSLRDLDARHRAVLRGLRRGPRPEPETPR
jgi:hypothetical protein